MADRPPVPGARAASARRAPSAAGAQAPASPSEAARLAAADTPGTGGTPGGDAAATVRPRATRTPNLQAKLEQFFAIPAMAFAAGGDSYSAEILAKRGPLVAEAWYELSKQNSTVKRMLESLVEGSAWGGVIFSTLSVVVPIAKHKGLYRGPDPFAFLMESPDAAPAQHAPQPQGKKPMTWSRTPDGPLPAPFVAPQGAATATHTASTGSGDDESIVQYLDGAPPGVVTVAASAASHNGAR